MKNLKEFKALIDRYESISIEEIERAFKENYRPAGLLTGFGSIDTCTLCMAVDVDCNECVWGPDLQGCLWDITYDAIYYATNPNKLFTAYRKRAAYMRKYLNEKGIS